ncbi:DASH complex subunit dad4 [Pilaira anomala]|nr:DASH complex subunit dad4 [Pilaira anomala]
MKNPHEEQQSALLNRIIANVRKLNQNMTTINDKLETINKANRGTEKIAQVWAAYDSSVKIHLDNQAKN